MSCGTPSKGQASESSHSNGPAPPPHACPFLSLALYFPSPLWLLSQPPWTPSTAWLTPPPPHPTLLSPPCFTLSVLPATYLLGSPCNKRGHTSSVSPWHSHTCQGCRPGPGPQAAATGGGGREPGEHVWLTSVWLPQENTSPSRAPPPFQGPNICLRSNSLLRLLGRMGCPWGEGGGAAFFCLVYRPSL